MSQNTVHKSDTSHGFKTVHKYPSSSVSTIEILNYLSVQLYPTGKAWYRPENGTWENLHYAINRSFARVVKESKLLLDQSIPDNDNFTENDALLWEHRLGKLTNPNLNLEVRKQLIRQTLGHPNNIKSRQTKSIIQSGLRLAGFDVFIHENVKPYKTPEDINNIKPSVLIHDDELRHSETTQHGGGGFDVIANSIESAENFSIGGAENLWASFFICGETLGSVVDIVESRQREFKELVLKLKPAHLVAFTFINYN